VIDLEVTVLFSLFGKEKQSPALTFPLHIHTATLFIVLTLALGVGQIWFNFQKSTELIEESSIVLYEKVMQSAFFEMKANHQMAASAVEIVAEGGLPETKTLEQ